MPRMDGTGPTGQGPGTGRGMGSCGNSGIGPQQPVSNQTVGWLKIALGVLGALGVGAYGISRGDRRGRGRRRTL